MPTRPVSFAVKLTLILVASAGLLLVPGRAVAQTTSRFGATPRLGGGLYGGRGISGQSRLRTSPLFNPAPSLTPHQVFRPAPSLSPSQLLNPSPSLFYPRGSATLGLPRAGSRRVLVPAAAAFPLGHQLAIMPRASVSTWLGVGSARLQEELRRFRNGPQWEAYLQIELMRKTAIQREENSSIETQKPDLARTLSIFERIAQGETYRRVRELDGFEQTHVALQELVEPSLTDHARFARCGALLHEQLKTLNGGERWAKHLELPDVASPSDAGPPAGAAEVLSVATVQLISERMKAVADDPKYRRISQLPAFAWTARNLDEYCDKLAAHPVPGD